MLRLASTSGRLRAGEDEDDDDNAGGYSRFVWRWLSILLEMPWRSRME